MATGDKIVVEFGTEARRTLHHITKALEKLASKESTPGHTINMFEIDSEELNPLELGIVHQIIGDNLERLNAAGFKLIRDYDRAEKTNG